MQQFIFAILSSWTFLWQFIFTDCRTGQCKNNVQCAFMEIFAAIYFHKLLFVTKVVKINWFTIAYMSRIMRKPVFRVSDQVPHKPGCTGFVQKHENEIPGLFQDNSRTFFSFQGLNFIDFQSIFDCFCRKTPNRKQVALHFYHRIIFIVVLINTGTTGN